MSWLVIFERLRQADSVHVFCDSTTRPACQAYWDRLQSRPAYRVAITDHGHPLISYGTHRIRQLKTGNEELRVLLEGPAGAAS